MAPDGNAHRRSIRLHKANVRGSRQTKPLRHCPYGIGPAVLCSVAYADVQDHEHGQPEYEHEPSQYHRDPKFAVGHSVSEQRDDKQDRRQYQTKSGNDQARIEYRLGTIDWRQVHVANPTMAQSKNISSVARISIDRASAIWSSHRVIKNSITIAMDRQSATASSAFILISLHPSCATLQK